MLFYFECFALALLISLSLHFVIIEDGRLSHKIHGYIEQTPVGLHINKVPQAGINYILKTLNRIYTENKNVFTEFFFQKVQTKIKEAHQQFKDSTHLENIKQKTQHSPQPTASLHQATQ